MVASFQLINEIFRIKFGMCECIVSLLVGKQPDIAHEISESVG